MAKVLYSQMVSGIAGRMDSQVYYRSRNSQFGYVRKYTYPIITENNAYFAGSTKGISRLWEAAHPDYRNDWHLYAQKYKDFSPNNKLLRQRTNSSFAIFVKCVWEVSMQELPHLDLDSIQVEDFPQLFADMISVATAVENGLIPKVDGWKLLHNNYV